MIIGPEYIRGTLAESPKRAFATVRVNDSDLVKEYRTEFFIARDTLPTEDEQYRLYRDLLEYLTPKPVTIQPLDTGGDKKFPFFTFTGINPFLGRRGIRFSLDHTEIFLTQPRALLRASAGIGNLQILFPMIS